MIFYTKAKDLAHASKAFQTSTYKVDAEARQVIEQTWDIGAISMLAPLVDLAGD